MPISSSDGRGKWKRRKRDAPTPRKPLKRDDHQEEEDEDEIPEDEAGKNVNHNGSQNAGEGSEDAQNANPSGASDTEVISNSAVRMCEFPSVMRMLVNRPHSSVMSIVNLERMNSGRGRQDRNMDLVPNLENISYGQLQAVSAVPIESLRVDQDGENPPWVITPPRIMEGKGVVKCFWNRGHVIPMHSDWFSPAIIHRLERQVVPHFFSGKSPEHSPEKYMECRNYIVAKYMVNPEKRIEVSDCRGLISGIEDDDLMRIFRFLDNWGIINYSAIPPALECWNGSSYLNEDNGEVHVPSSSIKSIDSLIKFDKPVCRKKSPSSCSDECPDLDSKIRERLSEQKCHYCSIPITDLHYQSRKEVDLLLCTNCFHEGKFVVGHSSLDFFLEDGRKDYGDLDGGDSWTDQETLLLLEAMEIFNENWNEIADYVGSKTKAQCILHFLRLPMEYGLLDSIDVLEVSELSNGDENLRLHPKINEKAAESAESERSLPFENAGNPLMALVAFLAYAVGPRVAAACAHASLAALSDDGRTDSAKLDGGDGNIQEGNSYKPRDEFRLRGEVEFEDNPLPPERVKSAAKVGLSAASMKAKLFADHEEREIQRLSANIVNHQLKRLELKLKQFAEVETLLMRECEQVEKTRQRFAAERARIQSTQAAASSTLSTMMNADAGISRPRMMGANQHMPFGQRGFQQGVFPVGPRLPLSAIQAAPAFNPPQGGASRMVRSVSGPRSGLG